MLFENYSDPSPKLTVQPLSSALPNIRPERRLELLAGQRHLRGGCCVSAGAQHTWRLHKPAKNKDRRSQKELVNSLMTPEEKGLAPGCPTHSQQSGENLPVQHCDSISISQTLPCCARISFKSRLSSSAEGPEM